MVNFQELQKWGFHNFTISEFQNGDYPKRRFPISFIGNGDFENIRILKEGRGDNSGFQIFRNSKRRGGYNLGDGKFSGIPKFNISKWRFQYFEMMARRWKFETLGNSDARRNSE